MTLVRRPIGNLLVATDFSEASGSVLERARQLPVTPGSTITLFHVVPGGLWSSPAEKEAATTAAEHLLAEAVARVSVGLAEGVAVHAAVEHGTPFVEIVRRARAERADLIVLGRHGHRTFADALIGSTAERVFRKGDVPVLIVGRASHDPYQRPMVAVDLSDTSRAALELALRVIDRRVNEVDVVHAWNARSAGDPAERDGSALARFLEDFAAAGVTWRVVSRPGDARAIILDEASKRSTDLLVLGTRGRSTVTQLLAGSVAEAVVRAASSDVLVARGQRSSFELP